MSGIMKLRIQKELAMLPYEVKVESDSCWVVSAKEFKLRVLFPSLYPFEAPFVEILEPVSVALYLQPSWGAACRIQTVIDSVPTRLNAFSSVVSEETRKTANISKKIPGDLTLLMGAAPNEDRRGRTIYTDPTIFLLDIHEPNGSEDYSRYFKINFADEAQMAYMATELPYRFKTIIFDYSTVKFFEVVQKTLVQRLISLKGMLQADGKIYMETPGCPGGVRMVGDTTNYYEIFLDACRVAGLKWERNLVNQLEKIPILQEVFNTGTYRTPMLNLLILSK